MRKRSVAALLLALVLCVSVAAAEEPKEAPMEREAVELLDEARAVPEQAEQDGPQEQQETVPSPGEPTEEAEQPLPSLDKFLTALPEGAGELLDAAALAAAPEFEKFWLELMFLVEEEIGAAETVSFEGEIPPPAAEISEDLNGYLALRLLAFARENGLLERTSAVKSCIERLVVGLGANHSPKSPQGLERLNAASKRFAACGKLADGVPAERLIVSGAELRLQFPPIAYNGQVLLAAEDIAIFLGGAVATQPQSDGLAIQSGTLLIELEKGSATVYLNDFSEQLPVPVLVFEDRAYASAELLALPSGKDCVSFDEFPCFIYYIF